MESRMSLTGPRSLSTFNMIIDTLKQRSQSFAVGRR